jgi:hypothetical protein
MNPDHGAWRTGVVDVKGNRCVPTGVAVRDTKDRARAPHVHSATAWRDFLTALRNREFDRS